MVSCAHDAERSGGNCCCAGRCGDDACDDACDEAGEGAPIGVCTAPCDAGLRLGAEGFERLRLCLGALAAGGGTRLRGREGAAGG